MKIAKPFDYELVSGCKFGTSPVGKPLLYSYVFHVDGLLVDTGHPRARQLVVDWADQFEVDQICLTHHHEDHSGNVNKLRGHLGCPVYASDACIELMKDPPRITPAQWMVWGDRGPVYDMLPLESQLKTANYCFDVIPVAGHSPDMVALHEPQAGWLFAADLYISSYISYFIVYESVREQIESLERVLKLDFDVLFCGHNLPLTDGHERLGQKLDFLRDFYGQVATLGAQGLSAKQIFAELRLREPKMVYYLSGGYLSKLNMVRAVLRDEAGVTMPLV